MSSTPIFSNEYNVIDHKLIEMMNKWMKYKNDIDDYTLLQEIKYQLGRDYYNDAVTWLKIFKDADWYRDDLK